MATATATDDGNVSITLSPDDFNMSPGEASGFAEALRVAAEHAARIRKEIAQRERAIAEVKEKTHDDMW